MNKLKKLREKLNDNELKYIETYTKTRNQVKSYQSVFPNTKTAHKNASTYHGRQRIQEYLRAMREKIEEKVIVDKQWVIDRLTKNAELGANGYELKSTDSQGNETIYEKKDISSSNRATELIGKELGMFTNELNINGLDELARGLVDKADELAKQVAMQDIKEDSKGKT